MALHLSFGMNYCLARRHTSLRLPPRSGLSYLVKKKNKHTLGNCNRCFELKRELQTSFPLKPMYEPPNPVVSIDSEALKRQGIQKFTSNVLTELNWVYASETSTTFTDAVLKTKASGLEKKRSKKEKRKEKRKIERELTKKVNKQFAEKAAITMLVEGESKRQYHRKRLAQSFCSPGESGQPAPKKIKTHSPNFENVSWDVTKLEETLRNCPPETPITWSKVAQEHGINGGNAGQIAKVLKLMRLISPLLPTLL